MTRDGAKGDRNLHVFSARSHSTADSLEPDPALGSLRPSHGSVAYYDDYWSGEALPDIDPLTPPRLAFFGHHVPPPARILDLGCGRGRCSKALTDAGYQVIGLDLSVRALIGARHSAQAALFAAADAEHGLPLASGSVDAVYMTEVLEHLFDATRALRECRRVLRPEGRLLLSVPYHGRVKNVLISLLCFDSHFDPCGPHIRFFTTRTLTRLLTRERFSVEKVRNLGRFFPVWKDMVVLARKVEGRRIEGHDVGAT